jgi:hypothetical protein
LVLFNKRKVLAVNLLHVQNRINELMARWVASVKGAASMSRTDLNHVSETILVPLLREIYDLPDLRNLNTESVNFPGIDLADDKARVAIQVTSTATSPKIRHTLTKFVDHKLYEQYKHLIVYILVEKQKTYSGKGFDDIIRGRFQFDKKEDIRDYRDLLDIIQGFQIDRAKRILDILEANFLDDVQRENVVTPKFDDAQALYQYVLRLLDENKIIHRMYGPESSVAKQVPLGGGEAIWSERKKSTIIPNNRTIINICKSNYSLISDDVWELFLEFEVHAEALEQGASSPLHVRLLPRFPVNFEKILRKETSHDPRREEGN